MKALSYALNWHCVSDNLAMTEPDKTDVWGALLNMQSVIGSQLSKIGVQ